MTSVTKIGELGLQPKRKSPQSGNVTDQYILFLSRPRTSSKRRGVTDHVRDPRTTYTIELFSEACYGPRHIYKVLTNVEFCELLV